MAWYHGTHACGHEGRVNVIGPHRTRKYQIERYFAGLCEECYKAKLEADREAARQEAAQKAAEMELPELTGSEKQVAWAMVLRQNLIDESLKLQEQYPEDAETIAYVLGWILENQISAAYYIDNQHMRAVDWLERVYTQIPPMEAKTAPPKEEVKDMEAEATIYPPEPKTPLAAKVTVLENRVEVRFPEPNEILRQVVKSLGYVWAEGRWTKKITKFSGPIADRAAEVAAKLLSVGIPVCVLDEAIRAMAVSGKYEPECKRWITKILDGKYAGWFAIQWDRKADDFYSVARALPGSRWESPRVIVPPQSYAEVLDFASMYQFKLSEGAKEVANKAAKLRDQALIASPCEPEAHDIPAPLTKPPVLEVPQEVMVDEALRDAD